MADPDAEARLLDGIVGKYGDDSDYGDLGNADEDALLEGYDDPDCGETKHSCAYLDDIEELDHEPEEPDIEDVLDLEAQDGELEEDEIDRSNLNLSNPAAVSSTTQPEINTSLLNKSELEERERNTDKFKNERQNPPTKSFSIPDSLDEIPVSAPIRNNNNNQNRNGPRMIGQMRGGRGGRGGINQRNNNNNIQNQQRNRPDNKTVLINPHFKGQVHINNDARLTWDARHRINQNKNQVGKVMPFSQNNRKQNETVPVIQPWINSNNNNNNGLVQNVPQYQPPPPVYQPVYQPPPQVSPWNQYPPNSYNQIPPQMGVNNTNQQVFMQQLPAQNLFGNNPMPQFNHPPPQFTPPPPVYQNQNMNNQPPVYNNSQYLPPPNQYHNQSIEPQYHQNYQQQNQLNPVFQQHSNNHFIPPPQNHQHFNPPPINNNRFVVNNQAGGNNNQLRNKQRFVWPKPNFNQGKGQFQKHNQNISPVKRKVDNNADLRKKKRNQSSTNLHEVPTVETPDTTVKEEKLPDDEDEETKAYRKRIEEQKKLRQQILEEKELRRRQLAQKLKQSEETTIANPLPTPLLIKQEKPQPQRQIPQKNLPSARPIQNVTESFPSTSSNNRPQVNRVFAQQQQQQAQNNRTIKIINTDNDESNYDKQHLASFLSNRKILAKDQSLVDTSLVVISNLAAGTTDVKLRKMCQGIGDIKKLQMSPKERQATIQFNSVASAHAFFKKYQRTMLDLSMIQVTLKPMP